jgi:uncharacterized protein (TIGR00156 family)
MQKIKNLKLLLGAPLLILFTAIVCATDVTPPMPMAVRAVGTLPDDTPVILVGDLVGKNGEEIYELRDITGMIGVKIGADILHNRKITVGERLRIYGKVERDGGRTIVKAKRLDLLH